jgi:thioredoxin-related protein
MMLLSSSCSSPSLNRIYFFAKKETSAKAKACNYKTFANNRKLESAKVLMVAAQYECLFCTNFGMQTFRLGNFLLNDINFVLLM